MSGDIKYFFSPFARMFQNNLLNDLSVSALTIIIAYRRCMNQSALPCGGKKKRWRRKWSREHTEKPSCNTKMVRRRWSLRWVCQSDLAIHIPQYFSLPVTSWERIWFCSLKCLFHFSRSWTLTTWRQILCPWLLGVFMFLQICVRVHWDQQG